MVGLPTRKPNQIPMRPDNCCRNGLDGAAVSLISKDIKNAGDPVGHQKMPSEITHSQTPFEGDTAF